MKYSGYIRMNVMNSSVNTYLVTGGCGFIGSYIVRDLLEKEAKVIIYDVTLNQDLLNLLLDKEQLNKVILVKGDIGDFKHLARVIQANRVDRIIHTASPLITVAEKNPSMALDLICRGTLNVFEGARLYDVEKVVWASSIAVFGAAEDNHKRKIRNDAPHRPNTLYGACKSLSEYLANYYADHHGLDSVGLRYTLVYGPGRGGNTKGAFATEMIRKAALEEPYEVPYGEATVDWQYVEDVSRLTVHACEAPSSKTRVFNTRGDTRPVKDVVNYLKGLVPAAQFTLKSYDYGLFMDCDTSPLEMELGFKPHYSMEIGVLKTLNTFRRQAGLSMV